MSIDALLDQNALFYSFEMPAFYRKIVDHFLTDGADAIVGQLTTQASRAGFYQQVHSQTEAWQQEIAILKNAFQALASKMDTRNWSLLLEYPIPRRAKRIDAVLLAEGTIFVLEFKCGAKQFTGDMTAQVEDYCLDLKDFHEASRCYRLVPVVIATDAPKAANQLTIIDQIAGVARANADTLSDVLEALISAYASPATIDAQSWDNSAYNPTPTIIEAARHLYSGQNVAEISRCHGGIENLTRTSETIIEAFHHAQQHHEKVICFITGVPGAGKTLAGLNIIHNKSQQAENIGAFLSGNGPLVRILTEALARDNSQRNGMRLEDSRRKVSTFIHNVHRFIDAYYEQPDQIPLDKLVVFDEAQRAWNKQQSERKFNRPYSEPELMLEIMDRHPDWSMIVALIGSGQEINSGEAGLAEWGRTLQSKFPHWKVLISPLLVEGHFSGFENLFPAKPEGMQLQVESALHLDVSLRAYRAEQLTQWVQAVLNKNSLQAAEILQKMDYPIHLTRSLDDARQWLKSHQRGTRRTGLIASSGGRRLRTHGLDVTSKIEVEDWFLNPQRDVRSSYALETVATEFDIQGLELDFTGLCWDGDLTPVAEGWRFRQFRGDKWMNVNDDIRKQYILNKYRVLLTRAREGMVIFVPPGSLEDETRPPVIYEDMAEYLKDCGVIEVQYAEGLPMVTPEIMPISF